MKIFVDDLALDLLFIFRELLQCFSVGYHSKVLTVPSDWLKNILLNDSIEQLHADCKYYGLTVDNQSIKFQRESFQSSKPTVTSNFQ